MKKLSELFSLKGKTALITGGGRGIGKFIATGLAEAGADLIITSRKMKNLEATAEEVSATYGVQVLPVACDMARAEDIESMVKAATEKFPRIDILVNNAGATWGAPTLEFPLDRWDQLFNVNVRGVWILTQKIANLMKDQGGGNIINISSIMAFRGSEELAHPAVPYNSTKAAINLLTMNLAVKLAPYNIRVNAIAPGFFRTDMMTYIEKPEFKKAYDLILSQIPMRRVGDLDDMRGVAVFLASDASAYMTGHVLVNDGGYLAK
ncbi:MAG TPA: glucose 1-dehydrogenase [Syntrophales bacterium]|nr:glucose 1-dehydrogenase [Syntrophobacterales bacterium]HRR40329.1 glucose 1-dehydrogenase [Syntrophales bacterium]HRT27488.1 glucose 1-dehydrogenase [Syntrophales bacterium]